MLKSTHLHPTLSAFSLTLMILGSSCIMGGCSGASSFEKPLGLYYEATMIRTPAPKPNERAGLVSSLSSLLKGRTVYRLKSGQKARVFGGAHNQLKRLSHAELRALWLTHDTKFLGAELDLKVRLYKKETAPVTVIVNLKGVITVEEGRWEKVKIPKSAREIESRWGLGPLKAQRGASWSKRALRSINLALSHLNDAERQILKGLPFVRKRQGRQAQQAALYVQSANCAAQIQVFNRAIKSERYTFSGEASHALPATVHAVVHEVGHAIHHRPGRRAQCQYLSIIKEYNKLIKSYNKSGGAKRNRLGATMQKKKKRLTTLESKMKKWMKVGPVLSAYKRAKGKSRGPTPYGTTSLAESFAESFALYRVDPNALRRVMPKVYRWFKSGDHIKLARSKP